MIRLIHAPAKSYDVDKAQVFPTDYSFIIKYFLQTKGADECWPDTKQ